MTDGLHYRMDKVPVAVYGAESNFYEISAIGTIL